MSPVSQVTAVVGDTSYLFVAGGSDNEVSVFAIETNGSLRNTDNVDDDDRGVLELDKVQSVTTANIERKTYLFAAGFDDDGVSVFSVGVEDGMLDNEYNLDNEGDLKLNGACSVTTAEVGGSTYLFVAGENADGVSVFRVND